MPTRRDHPTTTTVDLGRLNVALFGCAAAAAIGAVLTVGDIAGVERIASVLHRLDTRWLAICLTGQVAGYLGYVLALRSVARVDGGARLGLGLTARTVVAGFGVYAAAHAAGGFAVDYWALRRAGLSRREAKARVLALSILEYAVLAPAALACAMILVTAGAHVEASMTLPWLLVVPGALAAAWVSSPKRADRFTAGRDAGRVREAIALGVDGLRHLRSLARSPVEHAPGLLGVLCYWIGDIACLWAALEVFSVHVPVASLVLAYATGYVLTRRSLPAGGAGVVEVLMTLSLVWVGVGLAPALAGVVLYRVFNFWLPIAPALAVLPTVKQLRRDYELAERAGP